MKRVLILPILILLVFCLNLFSQTNTQVINDVKTLVTKATNYLKKGNPIDVLNKKDSPFVKPPLYVFTYKCLSDKVILYTHPYLYGKLVGKNIATLKDKRKKFFVLSICNKVKNNPNGIWDDYYWINPKTKKLEQKFTYCKGVGNIAVCGGFYKSQVGNITLNELNKNYR